MARKVNKRSKDPQTVYLNDATGIDRNGKAVNVEYIIAPNSNSECCRLDCCKKAIVFIDDANVSKEIPLDDIWNLLNP